MEISMLLNIYTQYISLTLFLLVDNEQEDVWVYIQDISKQTGLAYKYAILGEATALINFSFSSSKHTGMNHHQKKSDFDANVSVQKLGKNALNAEENWEISWNFMLT